MLSYPALVECRLKVIKEELERFCLGLPHLVNCRGNFFLKNIAPFTVPIILFSIQGGFIKKKNLFQVAAMYQSQ